MSRHAPMNFLWPPIQASPTDNSDRNFAAVAAARLQRPGTNIRMPLRPVVR